MLTTINERIFEEKRERGLIVCVVSERALAEKACLNVIKVSVAYFTIYLPHCTLITENSNRVESSRKEEGKSETNTLIWRFGGARFFLLPACPTNKWTGS